MWILPDDSMVGPGDILQTKPWFWMPGPFCGPTAVQARMPIWFAQTRIWQALATFCWPGKTQTTVLKAWTLDASFVDAEVGLDEGNSLVGPGNSLVTVL